MMDMNKKRIITGLSGGVDSAGSVLLLQSLGFEVITVSIKFSKAHIPSCILAEETAKQLGTTHITVDAESLFEEHVLRNFSLEYMSGRTPNPCILCNPLVKFALLFEAADKHDAYYVATGHYADIIEINDGFTLATPKSEQRDQTYMLYRLPQEMLARIIFPLAKTEKPEVRELVKSSAIDGHDRADSQELCFCDDYKDFLKERGFLPLAGDFVLPDGRKTPHLGNYYYTVGQRKHLGVSYSHPLYVQKHEEGDVILSAKDGVVTDMVTAESVVINPHVCIKKGERYYGKIRSTSAPVECVVEEIDEYNLTVKFTKEVFAPSPGQSIVLYKKIDERLVVAGGGIIKAY